MTSSKNKWTQIDSPSELLVDMLQPRIQSIDALDNDDFLDYIDTLSEVINSHDDNLRDTNSLTDELGVKHDNQLKSTDKEEPKDSLQTLEDQLLMLEEEDVRPVGNMQPKSDDTIRISSFNPN